MTDFKVTIQALEAACVAHYGSAWPKFNQHERDSFRKEMRAALEAALPVMFEQYGFSVAGEICDSKEQAERQSAYWKSPITELYAIKEPK